MSIPRTSRLLVRIILVIYNTSVVIGCSYYNETECSILPVESDVLWMGYYGDTWLYLAGEHEGGRGPEVSLDGNLLIVTWKAAIFEDCRPIEGYCFSKDGELLYFDLINRRYGDRNDPNRPVCIDNNIIADISTSVFLENGKYKVNVKCSATGFQAKNGEEETFTIKVE